MSLEEALTHHRRGTDNFDPQVWDDIPRIHVAIFLAALGPAQIGHKRKVWPAIAVHGQGQVEKGLGRQMAEVRRFQENTNFDC